MNKLQSSILTILLIFSIGLSALPQSNTQLQKDEPVKKTPEMVKVKINQKGEITTEDGKPVNYRLFASLKHDSSGKKPLQKGKARLRPAEMYLDKKLLDGNEISNKNSDAYKAYLKYIKAERKVATGIKAKRNTPRAQVSKPKTRILEPKGSQTSVTNTNTAITDIEQRLASTEKINEAQASKIQNLESQVKNLQAEIESLKKAKNASSSETNTDNTQAGTNIFGSMMTWLKNNWQIIALALLLLVTIVLVIWQKNNLMTRLKLWKLKRKQGTSINPSLVSEPHSDQGPSGKRNNFVIGNQNVVKPTSKSTTDPLATKVEAAQDPTITVVTPRAVNQNPDDKKSDESKKDSK